MAIDKAPGFYSALFRANCGVAVAALATLSLLGLLGCQEPLHREDASPKGEVAAAELYRDHCAACHGVDGRGDGPISRGLISFPADLTRIAERRGGHFPSEEVRSSIDGRSDLAGHRGPEMPRWGEFWDQGAASGTEATGSPEINALVGFLESIQRTGAAKSGENTTPRSTRERMAALVAALEKALPAIFSDAAFSDSESRRSLSDAVALLATGAEDLETHAQDQSDTFDPLARSLAEDARRIRAAFDAGELRRTRFRFGDLLENCVACHARLPDPLGSDLGRRLAGQIERKTLAPAEELRLLLATRQFEAARDRYEEHLAEGDLADIDRRGLLVDYLIVNLRIFQDPTRPRLALERLMRERNIGPVREAELQNWVASLDAIGSLEAGTNQLGQARDLLKMAEKIRLDADPGASLVYDIAASGHLFQYIESASASDAKLADAHYLLGLTESRIRRPVGRERWDDYLEAAIRLAPGTQTSRASFQLYKENRLAQYEGLSVLTLPRGELRRFEELRALALRVPTP